MIKRFFLLLLPLLFLSACDDAPSSKSMGIDAKTLVLKSVDNKDYKLSWRIDTPVILNVWATWCAPCVKELPSLIKLDKNPEFAVLAVSIDNNPAVIKNFLTEYGFEELTVVWDKNGQNIRNSLGLKGVPTTYILNKDQMVVGIEQGERDWNHPDMIKKIKAYLHE